MPSTAAVAAAPATNGKKPKLSKNQIKRARKKEKKADVQSSREQSLATESEAESASTRNIKEESTVPGDDLDDYSRRQDEEDFTIREDLLNFREFMRIMNRFQPADDDDEKKEGKQERLYDDDDAMPDEDEDNLELLEQKMSRREKKKKSKLSIAELKAISRRPEIVDWWDVDADQPGLLVHLKGYRNSVPVPEHWSLKREYLSTKRGVEKPKFQLPAFIAATGIGEMRDAILEKQADQTLKQKMRERVQPKMGRMDVDYQKLYEAFFRFQTKPELTRYGEVYYEGKEYETNLRHLRPGELSRELKEALNIPPGAPPPWLINMQRFGPPPSYPNLRIAGLNAPPPAGASWGFHPGGYGKPPVDEFNRPLYGGDIFGVMHLPPQQNFGEPVQRNVWGELEAAESSSEEEEEDEEEEQEDEDEEITGMEEPIDTAGGVASTIPAEIPTSAAHLDVRKRREGTETEDGPRNLYTVLEEKSVRNQGFFGSDRAYDINNKGNNANLPVLGEQSERKRKRAGDVDVALDPDALQAEDGISKEELQRRFDEQKTDQQVGSEWAFQEDLSELIASETQKRAKRDELRKSKR